MNSSRLDGQVRIVGTGLLGTSAALGLRALGVDVVLHDASPTALELAIDYGAGRRASADDAPALILVAVPPDRTAEVVAAELEAFPDALVTDVASVKAAPLAALQEAGVDTSRYLGGHPLAGREKGGPIAARADLFLGRPWVITPQPATTTRQLAVLEDLVLDLGAVPVLLDPEEHDLGVALVSHVPQVVSSLLAARLIDGAESALGLTGQGLRDTTRIAASDPELWIQILGANAQAVAGILSAFRDDLSALIEALEHPEASGARRAIAGALAAGNAGVARLPGKHGRDRVFTTLVIMVEDRPGQLARLLHEIGELDVNMEDLRLEHSPGAEFGLAEVQVLPEAAAGLAAALEERGWRIAEQRR